LRITEPFIKLSYALWLVDKGARVIRVSVDGAEPEHEIVAKTLESKGYKREPISGSKVNWTGLFSKEGVEIIVISHSGIDIEAHFPDGKIIVAECKGEPTPSGVKSGLDLTAFYTALGQLIITADGEGKLPSHLLLVLPDNTRLRDIAVRATKNARFKKSDIGLALVDESGQITEIIPGIT
jgi:hypothetical protein